MIVVNELLRLWKDGIRIATAGYPEGRLIRVILVCVICDKPAAHKLGGFGSHAHRFFCTRCWAEQADKATSQSFEANGRPDDTCAQIVDHLLLALQVFLHAQTRAPGAVPVMRDQECAA